jgi:hypothetical protein
VVDTSYQDTGQDWSTDSFTPAERAALIAWYASQHGLGTMEFCQFVPYMLGLREDALKRYRHWTEYVPSGKGLEGPIGPGTVMTWLHYYVINGYADGYMYEVIAARKRGASRAEVAQATAIGWLHGGPRGLNVAASKAAGYLADWPAGEPSTLDWPAGWAPDPEAFRSGADLDPDKPLTAADLRALRDWHTSAQGAVPAYVDVLARGNPGALKLWRARYEAAMTGPLPRQLIALLQVHAAGLLQAEEPLRRAVHMALRLGASRGQVIQVLSTPHVYLGDLGMTAIGSAAGLIGESGPPNVHEI